MIKDSKDAEILNSFLKTLEEDLIEYETDYETLETHEGSMIVVVDF